MGKNPSCNIEHSIKMTLFPIAVASCTTTSNGRDGPPSNPSVGKVQWYSASSWASVRGQAAAAAEVARLGFRKSQFAAMAAAKTAATKTGLSHKGPRGGIWAKGGPRGPCRRGRRGRLVVKAPLL